MSTENEIFELLELLQFDQNGLIPAVIQDYQKNDVLMVAYMNRDSVQKTLETGKTWFWSRERKRLWMKGESSGNVQNVKNVYVDCDYDTLLFKVEQVGGAACHKGYRSCFFREIEQTGKISKVGEPVFNPAEIYESQTENILKDVYKVVLDRKLNPQEKSYTSYLFEKGKDKILKKVGEEATEVVIASKNDNPSEIIYEMADLWFHNLVLLGYHDIKPEDIYEELKKRRLSK